MAFFVYMLASKRNGTLYIGSTDALPKRMWLHRNEILPGFTKDYGVKQLVWYEPHKTRESALLRERRLKKWNRKWKLDLIEGSNPEWRDLGEECVA
jgi:putative endonuclease